MGGTRRRIVIVGAGPAGLSFARALADTPAEITLIERAPLAALAEPRFDGREIALTHRSERALRDLDAWSRISVADIHRLDRGEVLSGRARFAMRIDPGAGDARPLGHLVSNHHLRRALFESVAGQANMDLRAGCAVERVQAGRGGVTVTLADGAVIEADLLVAADSRFSAIRDQLGIGADVRPVGKTMLVGRVGHAPCKAGVATEWFARHHTLAMLPLGEGLSSAVISLTPEAAESRSCWRRRRMSATRAALRATPPRIVPRPGHCFRRRARSSAFSPMTAIRRWRSAMQRCGLARCRRFGWACARC